MAGSEDVERRTVRAAEAVLAERRAVCALDLLLGLGWLAPSHVDHWRQGRLESLEAAMGVGPAKLSVALASFAGWASARGLVSEEVEYVARTLDRRTLRFSASGDPELERAYRRHWLSPALSPAKREQLVRRERRPPELVVIQPLKEWTCVSCGGTGASMLIMEAPGPLCLACVDLEHLVFLAAGDPALTRRARSSSRLAAVVVRFSRTRKRYERQGILVEEEALRRAERECLSDGQARERRRAREAERRERQDGGLRERFAAEIARLFPGCPPSRAVTIAAHAAERGSGRVGRSAAGRALDPTAVELAVVAAVRHGETEYDSLLMRGVGRLEARDRVRPTVERTLERWRTPPPADP